MSTPTSATAPARYLETNVVVRFREPRQAVEDAIGRWLLSLLDSEPTREKGSGR